MTRLRSDQDPAPTSTPGATEPPPLVIRAALRTWARRDRAASGEAVAAVALDLIDGGSSPLREARGLAWIGLVLRVRGTGRDVAAAPWGRGAPLILAALLGTLAVIAATSVGGWQRLWSGEANPGTYGVFYGGPGGALGFLGANGLKFAAAGCLLAVAAAAGRRRWLAAAFVALTGAAVVQAYISSPILPTIVVSFGYPAALESWGPAWQHERSTAISLFEIVALLGMTTLLVALAWAVAGRLRRGPSTATAASHATAARAATASRAATAASHAAPVRAHPDSSGGLGLRTAPARSPRNPNPNRSRSRNRNAVLIGAAFLAALAAPTIARLLASAALHAGLPAPAAQTNGASDPVAAGPLFLIWILACAALATAALAARRAPAAALAGAITLLPLATHAFLAALALGFTGPREFAGQPPAGSTWQQLIWPASALVLLLLVTTVAAAAGRSERRRLAARCAETPSRADLPSQGALA